MDHKRRFNLCALLSLLIGALVCSFYSPTHAQSGAAPVEELLKAMPLDQRIGQMFMVSIYGEGLNDTGRAFLKEMTPGAVAAFTSNGTGPARINATVNAWQEVAVQSGAKIPYIVAIDHEGGTVTRLTEGFTPIPWGAALGAMPPAQAQKVAQIAAQELRAVGISMDLAPVADVRSDPVVNFMERRAFGPDPERVSGAVAAYITGLQSSGMISTLKHFPGHGTAGDSHLFLPRVASTREQIEIFDLPPFRAGIAAGASVVMVGHLNIPALESKPDIPATFSRAIVTDLLRGELGFTGVIMTDAMDMGAVVNNFTATDAAVRAVQAGIDLIASGPNLSLTRQLEMKAAIRDAVLSGQISEERIDESARRILKLKAQYGLLAWQPFDPASAEKRLNRAAHEEQLESIYLNTVAVSYDFAELLPLNPTKQIGLIFPGVYPAVQRECLALSQAIGQTQPASLTPKTLAYSLNPSNDEIVIARQIGKAADVIVVFTYNLDEHRRQADLVNSLPQAKTVVVALQNPYDYQRGIDPSAYVAIFNPIPPAFRAVCAVLYGKQKPVGVFPVIQG